MSIYKKCSGCGANSPKIKNNRVECEYCGRISEKSSEEVTIKNETKKIVITRADAVINIGHIHTANFS